MFSARGMSLAILGIAIGGGTAGAVTRSLDSLLFGLGPQDPGTFVVALMGFGVVALVASYVPARGASRVDPMAALRSE